MTDFDVVDALAGFAEDLKSEAAFAERLHAAVVKMKAAHDTERDALVAEIKRLRGALYSVMGVCHDECSCSCAASVVAKLALYDFERHKGHALVYMGHDPAVCAHGCGSQVAWALGFPERAEQHDERAIALARRVAHAPTLAFSLWYVSGGRAFVGSNHTGRRQVLRPDPAAVRIRGVDNRRNAPAPGRARPMSARASLGAAT